MEEALGGRSKASDGVEARAAVAAGDSLGVKGRELRAEAKESACLGAVSLAGWHWGAIEGLSEGSEMSLTSDADSPAPAQLCEGSWRAVVRGPGAFEPSGPCMPPGQSPRLAHL